CTPRRRATLLPWVAGFLARGAPPFFSGWYSKDAILAQAAGFALVHKEHALLFLLPLITAGITTFYMFRMWFLTFTGEPQDEHVYEHAHESPRVMTMPLVILAFFSIVVAWGWPVWDAEASWLEHNLHHAQHAAVVADFGFQLDEPLIGTPTKDADHSERALAQRYHGVVGNIALFVIVIP